MTFHINLTSSAAEDLDYFDAYEQRIIMAAVHTYLVHDAHIPTKRRKQLESNPRAPWELKKDNYRIFYDIIADTVDILAIGYKDHNDLFIRGRRVRI
jgi:mRNA-degrading endonuclease RelE of RelBE toxin-antitoxin system